MTWMAVVTRNCALSRLAAAPPPSFSLDEAGLLAAVEARPSGDPVIVADVRECLKKLNEKYSKCVTLIYLHGLSYEELATQMGAPREVMGSPDRRRLCAWHFAWREELSDTLTRRAGTGVWTEMSPGVTYSVLFDDPVTKRRSMLVRALPGATYESHFHDQGHEECLVLEGDLVMGDLKLLAGDFHLAAKGSSHPPAHSATGCLLHISTAL